MFTPKSHTMELIKTARHHNEKDAAVFIAREWLRFVRNRESACQQRFREMLRRKEEFEEMLKIADSCATSASENSRLLVAKIRLRQKEEEDILKLKDGKSKERFNSSTTVMGTQSIRNPEWNK